MKPTRRLAEHIEASTHLRDLAEKAAQLNAATKTLRSVLPDELMTRSGGQSQHAGSGHHHRHRCVSPG